MKIRRKLFIGTCLAVLSGAAGLYAQQAGTTTASTAQKLPNTARSPSPNVAVTGTASAAGVPAPWQLAYPAQFPATVNGQSAYPPGYVVEGSRYGTTAPPYLSGEQLARMKEEQAQAFEFQKAVTALREADTDEKRVEAKEKLTALVSAQLDRDLDTREKALVEIEKKAKMMRDQIEQQRTMKSERVKLLTMLIENPQGGLGVPAEWLQSVNNNRWPSGYSQYPSTSYSVPVTQSFEGQGASYRNLPPALSAPPAIPSPSAPLAPPSIIETTSPAPEIDNN